MRDITATAAWESSSGSCVRQIAADRMPSISRSRTVTGVLGSTSYASSSSSLPSTTPGAAGARCSADFAIWSSRRPRVGGVDAVCDPQLRVGGAGRWSAVGARDSTATTARTDGATRSWIHKVKQGLASLAVLAVLSANAMEAPGPWGIDDPGIEAGVLRTEFDDPRAGTTVRPLRVDCAASANPTACAGIDTVFRASNSYASGPFGTATPYWMLTVNNDKSFVERCEEYGPPDQSIPISHPGAGLVGISSFAGPTGKVIDLDVNQLDFRNPCGSDAAPFVGFGAHWGRGNSTPIGYLNAEGSVTIFSARLIEYASAGGFVYARHWIYAVATWEGVRHLVAVHLFGLDGNERGSLSAPEDNGVTSDWKWPYLDSWYYPGAKVAVFPAWAVGLSIPQPGFDMRYAIDWQRLFEKAWPDMSTNPIPIEAVAFANEIAGAVHLHSAVSDVHQISAPPESPAVSLKINGVARAKVDPGESLHYVWEADNALWVSSRWETKDIRCGLGSSSGMWEAKSRSGSSTWQAQAAQSGCTYDIVITACSYNGCASDGITVVVR